MYIYIYPYTLSYTYTHIFMFIYIYIYICREKAIHIFLFCSRTCLFFLLSRIHISVVAYISLFCHVYIHVSLHMHRKRNARRNCCGSCVTWSHAHQLWSCVHVSFVTYMCLFWIEKAMLAVTAAVGALRDPTRADFVATLGDTTGAYMLRQMRHTLDQRDPEIVQKRPT